MAKKPANSAAVVVPIAEPINDISPIEQTVNAFEYAAWHFGLAFARWRRDCLIAMPANSLGGTEASILHVLHLNGTPKGLSDVARLLHRDDLANLQYGLKEAAFAGFYRQGEQWRLAPQHHLSSAPIRPRDRRRRSAAPTRYAGSPRRQHVRNAGRAAAGDLDFACDDRALRSGQHDPFEPDRGRSGPPAVRDKSQLQSMNSSYELPLD